MRRARKGALAQVGPVPERAAMGDGPRGLQPTGDAWNYFTHDQARSRAYRWGEDGLAGISDDQQLLCFALALWNGKDPILKERLFGLTNSEGNHGEDVKEYYFYLDSTPTHSYMKYLYKYPQAAYPYEDSSRRTGARPTRSRVRTARYRRIRRRPVFRHLRRVCKASPEDMLIHITVHNRGPEAATLHVLPTIWFRNTGRGAGTSPRPALKQIDAGRPSPPRIPRSASATLHRRRRPDAGSSPRTRPTPSVSRRAEPHAYVRTVSTTTSCTADQAVNPDATGTKAAAHYRSPSAPGASQCCACACRTAGAGAGAEVCRPAFDAIVGSPARGRRILRGGHPVVAGRRRAQRHAPGARRDALVEAVLQLRRGPLALGAGADPFKPRARAAPRNDGWHHMYNADVISMPDKWEYPWYAAWDLAFHVLALTLVDEDFGKQQLDLMLRERYIHPNGQIPAYEWNFGDVNPPVHAWSTIFTYRLEQARRGAGRPRVARALVPQADAQLHLVGQPQGPHGSNVFEGGFLGLDNIGVFDRSSPLPTGGYLEQADGTAWMALFCQNMLEIAVELALEKPAYADMCHQVHRALPVDRLVDDPCRRRCRHVGRGGRLLLRRAAAARRQGRAAQGAFDGRAAAAVCRHGFRRRSC